MVILYMCLLYLTLCDPMDCSPPASFIRGILQTRILEWLSFPSPGDLSNPGIEPASLALDGRFLINESPGKPLILYKTITNSSCIEYSCLCSYLLRLFWE